MYDYNAVLVRVVDGDTVVLDLDLGFFEWRKANDKKTEPSYRLSRINAPELPTVDGVNARTHLIQLISDKKLTVHTEKTDHFARYVVELYAGGPDGNEFNVNDQMVRDGFAVYKTYA